MKDENTNHRILVKNREYWWKEIQKASDFGSIESDAFRKKGEACPIRGCSLKVAFRRVCAIHYQRMQKCGSFDVERPIGCKNGKWNPRWKGGEIKIQDGRTLVYVENHPFPSHSGGNHVLRYRLVMEKAIGRYLLPHEIVHHKNGDCTDDRIENLELMSQSDHIKEHLPEMNKIRLNRLRSRKNKETIK